MQFHIVLVLSSSLHDLLELLLDLGVDALKLLVLVRDLALELAELLHELAVRVLLLVLGRGENDASVLLECSENRDEHERLVVEVRLVLVANNNLQVSVGHFLVSRHDHCNHEVEHIANQYPGLDLSATLAKAFYKSLKVKPGPITALHYILRQTESEVVSFDDNDKKSDEFMRILSTGLGLEKGNPILYFRNSLIKQMSEQIKIPPHFIIRGGILTWNNWIKGKKITRFVLGSDSKIPTAVRPI